MITRNSVWFTKMPSIIYVLLVQSSDFSQCNNIDNLCRQMKIDNRNRVDKRDFPYNHVYTLLIHANFRYTYTHKHMYTFNTYYIFIYTYT